jgi:hypothetical protein
MRTFRSVRLAVVAALAVPLLCSAILLPGSAWAKTPRSKPATCQSISGTYGGTWYLIGCGPPEITGDSANPSGTSSAVFPSSPTTITWSEGPNPHLAPLQTTIAFSVTPKKNKCGAGSSEYALSGTIVSNSASPGVKGHVKMFVCVSAGGALSAKKPLKL